MKPVKTDFVIVDANSLFSKAFHSGDNPYISVNLLSDVLDDLKYKVLMFAFDAPNCFRKSIYPEYKAGRKTDEPPMTKFGGLTRQDYLAMVEASLRQAGYQVFKQEGAEADDIIGSLAKQTALVGKTLIVSADKDLFQLIAPNVAYFYLSGKISQRKVYTRFMDNLITKKLGIPRQQLIDFKALAGESTDSIPGVHGIGPVNATKLLLDYKNLTEIYKALDAGKIDGKVAEKLTEGKGSAFMSYELAKIRTDIQLDWVDTPLGTFSQLTSSFKGLLQNASYF